MRIWLCVGILMASTVSAYATVAVPEIDAFSGLAAMAVVGSITALIWEHRRKKKTGTWIDLQARGSKVPGLSDVEHAPATVPLASRLSMLPLKCFASVDRSRLTARHRTLFRYRLSQALAPKRTTGVRLRIGS
jgi:hypothetical protein